jgi:hypothetical protein
MDEPGGEGERQRMDEMIVSGGVPPLQTLDPVRKRL